MGFIPSSQGWFNIWKINVIHHKQKSKTTRSVISIDAEKAFDKNLTSIHDGNSYQRAIEGTYLNIIKAIYDKPTANKILNKKKAESLPAKIWNKMSMTTFTTFIQYSIGSPRHSNQISKINKRHPNWKRRGKIVTI